jgi:uncharacterized membrane protein YbhN (UPF0104 family)
LLIYIYVKEHLFEFRLILTQDLILKYLYFIPFGVFLFYLVNSEILRLSLLFHGVKISFCENLSLTFAASLINNVIPLKGAVGLKALYLKKRHGLFFTDFLAQTALIALITLSIASLFALIGLIFLNAPWTKPRLILSVYFALGLLLVFFIPFIKKIPYPQKLRPLMESILIFNKKPHLILKIILLDILYFFFWTFINWLSLSSLGLDVGFFSSLFYAGGQIHTLIINLTPAGFGVMEAYSVFAGGILGFSPAEALVAQGFLRLGTVLVLSFFGLIGYFHLIKNRTKSFKKA